MEMLRNRTTVDHRRNMSDTLFVKGISRLFPEEELIQLFSLPYEPLDMDFSMKNRGQIWFKYETIDIAFEVLRKTHQQHFYGVSLIVRFEFGTDSNGKHILDSNSHQTLIRSIQVRKGGNIHSTNNAISYTHRSILCGDMEYPFPTGLYLTKIIQLTNIYPSNNSLLNLLRDTQFYGNKYSKEMSECMAMADCVQRAVRLVYGYCCSVYDEETTPREEKREEEEREEREEREAEGNPKESPNQVYYHPNMLSNVMVYVLGDGVRPLCAAAICLHIPRHYNWKYISIDPLMTSTNLGPYSNSIEIVQGYSQEYQIPHITPSPPLSIIISCHSHAPIGEFWERIMTPKIAIIMPCCADYGDLPGYEPIFEFLDYEVYSPKRTIKIYFMK